MTVSESVIAFLKRFEAEGLNKIKDIDTDLLKVTTASYALTKAPKETVQHYLSGTEIHTDYFEFRARLDSQSNTDRIDNQVWFESLVNWIEEMNIKKDFPALKEEFNCQKIAVSQPFYMGQSDEKSAIYQLTISITYRKEGTIGV